MSSSCLTLLLLPFLSVAAVTKPTRTKVLSIPGFGVPPTRHWSGFVPLSRGGNTLFYYLVESENSPANDPLIWWFNGGPGASSLAGFISENGPLLINEQGKLVQNPYSWNKNANMLYVEFAPGIGYSYCDNSSRTDLACNQTQSDCSPCYASDSSVVNDNVDLLLALLKGGSEPALFPEFAGRALYLAGESYAGVYIPTLAKALLAGQLDTTIVNLHGLWVTDPCTDNDAQFGFLDLGLDFAYQNSLITQPVYQTLSSDACTSGRTKVGDRVRNVGQEKCRHAWRQYDMATAGIGDAVHPANIPGLPMYIDPLNAIGPVSGFDIEGWFNSDEVREAIHATQSPNKVYHMELGNNGYPQYHLEYAACNDDASTNTSMVDVYRDIVALSKNGAGGAANFRRVIISSGDIDPVVNLHGTERAVNKIGFPVRHGEDRRPWFFNSTATDRDTMLSKPVSWGQTLHALFAGPQVGGFTTGYETSTQIRFDFVTVRASGHMVPAYAPLKSLHVITRLLLNGGDLTPALPDGWDTSSDDTFYARGATGTQTGTFAQWVNKARSSQFLEG